MKINPSVHAATEIADENRRRLYGAADYIRLDLFQTICYNYYTKLEFRKDLGKVYINDGSI